MAPIPNYYSPSQSTALHPQGATDQQLQDMEAGKLPPPPYQADWAPGSLAGKVTVIITPQINPPSTSGGSSSSADAAGVVQLKVKDRKSSCDDYSPPCKTIYALGLTALLIGGCIGTAFAAAQTGEGKSRTWLTIGSLAMGLGATAGLYGSCAYDMCADRGQSSNIEDVGKFTGVVAKGVMLIFYLIALGAKKRHEHHNRRHH